MAKGGARSGAGRKKESPNIRKRLTVEDIKKARESGEMPHDFLLRIARGEAITLRTSAETSLEYYPTFEERVTAAIKCAPFFVPTLQAIEQKIEVDQVVEISSEPLTEAEWAARYGNTDNMGTPGGTTESTN